MAERKKARGERPADRTRAMNAYLVHLDHPRKAEIAALRTIIMHASDKMSERVKWDAPSFYYRRDFATLDLQAMKYVHLVFLFPAEMTIPDPHGLIEVDPEGRREATFRNLGDVALRKPALQQLVRDFVSAMQGPVA